jgi:hypothetical protein
MAWLQSEECIPCLIKGQLGLSLVRFQEMDDWLASWYPSQKIANPFKYFSIFGEE